MNPTARCTLPLKDLSLPGHPRTCPQNLSPREPMRGDDGIGACREDVFRSVNDRIAENQ
jgi:hypothetical protein